MHGGKWELTVHCGDVEGGVENRRVVGKNLEPERIGTGGGVE